MVAGIDRTDSARFRPGNDTSRQRSFVQEAASHRPSRSHATRSEWLRLCSLFCTSPSQLPSLPSAPLSGTNISKYPHPRGTSCTKLQSFSRRATQLILAALLGHGLLHPCSWHWCPLSADDLDDIQEYAVPARPRGIPNASTPVSARGQPASSKAAWSCSPSQKCCRYLGGSLRHKKRFVYATVVLLAT